MNICNNSYHLIILSAIYAGSSFPAHAACDPVIYTAQNNFSPHKESSARALIGPEPRSWPLIGHSLLLGPVVRRRTGAM